MNKYIDAERLKAEVKHLRSEWSEWSGYAWEAANQVLKIIDSLQQEQPEVDLEKVLSGFIGRYAHENSGEYPSAIDIARYFYDLRLNTRKEE